MKQEARSDEKDRKRKEVRPRTQGAHVRASNERRTGASKPMKINHCAGEKDANQRVMRASRGTNAKARTHKQQTSRQGKISEMQGRDCSERLGGMQANDGKNAANETETTADIKTGHEYKGEVHRGDNQDQKDNKKGTRSPVHGKRESAGHDAGCYSAGGSENAKRTIG